MKEKLLGGLETFAKAMVQPLMYLSSAGILMVVGVLLTNDMLLGVLPFFKWEPIQIFGILIYNCIMAIINNLAVIFAIGIPAALAKKEKHKAALIGFMSYIIYLTASNTMLTSLGQLAKESKILGLIGTGQATILGIQVVDTSVFGGIILGCIAGYVFNRTSNKTFKGALQIYSGANFSFICMFFVSILIGVVSNFIWPLAQQGIASLANVIKDTGTFGLFLYGFLERILVPTGLHHLIYTPFQFSDLGGVLKVGADTVSGAYAIVMTEINLPVERFSDSIYYMATGFTKMFGYIGIGAAFIYTAYKQNKKKVKATIIPLIITAVLASVTEPLDFMFVFCAPLLFFVHAVIAGLFIALLKIFDVTALCGGNLLVSIIMNTTVGVEKTHWPVMMILGLAQIIVYFVVFSFLIKKFNYKTPGREDESTATGEEQSKQLNLDAGIENIIDGLGGKENINTVENCITRLRVNVKDESKINEDIINLTPNSGIVRKGKDIQIIFGLHVHEVRRAVEDFLEAY
ncbi:PTS transporter subunit EIIC [Clostridioides difficile]|uniref:PTS transporter subunit EIIC n=1 Tax=Clostridioides difficile TaxID=1496 RepID=UPI000BB1AC38|nr:PTS transporter subunit EIIC [Clostridioides difficile]PBE18095.1 PTS glucose transporter subunit IIBC [Clostridioides difficile]